MVVWTKLASIQMCGHCCRRQLPLTLPGAPALHRRITAGPSARRGTSTPPRPSSSHCACCPAPWLPPPAAIPKQNKAGEGTLRGAEPGPVTPSPSRPPPSAGDVKALEPRPPAGQGPIRRGCRIWGEGRGQGPQGAPRGSQGEAEIGRKKGGFWLALHSLAQSPGPHVSRLCVPTPLLPCFCPLISGVYLRSLLISPHLYPGPLLPPVVYRHSQRGQARSASRERGWPYAIDPGDQGAVGNPICLPPGSVRLRQPAESTAVGWGMGIQNKP